MCSQKLGVVVSKATHNTVASGTYIANVNTCDITLVDLISVLYMLRLFMISEQHAAKGICTVTANSHGRDWTELVLTASCVAPFHLHRAVRSFVSVRKLTRWDCMRSAVWLTSLCIFETNGNVAFACCVIFKLCHPKIRMAWKLRRGTTFYWVGATLCYGYRQPGNKFRKSPRGNRRMPNLRGRPLRFSDYQ